MNPILRFFLNPPQGPASILLIRLAVGLIFFTQGILKYTDPNIGVARFTRIGFPHPYFTAHFVGALEIACGALVLLDERGPSTTSEEWAADIGRARDASLAAYAVAIGGPDGLDPSLGPAAHRSISFGSMTWPHQLVRVMAGEQLYRAVTILAGHPYHRR